MNIIKVFFGTLASLAFQVAFAAELSHVVIDTSNPATINFVGVPKAFPADKFQTLKDELAQSKGVHLISWHEFKSDLPKHVRQYIRRNDYPNFDVVSGLARLLERYEGTIFGLTWNGGLAITGNDYRHSELSYAAFLRDPASFTVSERRLDPVHPANHLEPLLSGSWDGNSQRGR